MEDDLMTEVLDQSLHNKRFSYHQFKEKPGLLQSTFPHTSTAHHPLEGQLFMEELEQNTEVEEQRKERGGQTRRDNKGR